MTMKTNVFQYFEFIEFILLSYLKSFSGDFVRIISQASYKSWTKLNETTDILRKFCVYSLFGPLF